MAFTILLLRMPGSTGLADKIINKEKEKQEKWFKEKEKNLHRLEILVQSEQVIQFFTTWHRRNTNR